jgi:hypothetical protein
LYTKFSLYYNFEISDKQNGLVLDRVKQ